MRILSNFSDYYDKGLMYGVDELLVYKRLSSTIQITESPLYEPEAFLNYKVRPFILHFCGHTHIGVRFEKFGYDFNSKHGKFSIYNTHTLDNLLDKLEKEYEEETRGKFGPKEDTKKVKKGTKMTVESWINNQKVKYNYRRHFDELVTTGLYDKKKLQETYNNVCIENNIPYIVIYMETEGRYSKKHFIEHNPQLNMWDFIKVKTPIEAFQEISMYVGGVLQQPINTMVEISNQSMMEKKGFSHKYAFRKEPEDKSKIK